MSTKIAFNQIDGAAVSVKDFGAKGDWSNDDGVAIQEAFAKAQADRVSWTNTGKGENPTSASKPPVVFSNGVYETTVPLTNDIHYTFMDVYGQGAIVADNPLRTVDNAFSFGYDWSIEGIEIRGFVDGIVINNANVNQSHHYITNCHFHGQSQAAIRTEGTPGSGQLVLKNFTFSGEGGKLYHSDSPSSRISYLKIADGWVQPNLSPSGTIGTDGAVIDAYSTLTVLENLNCVPLSDYSVSTTVPPHWIRTNDGSNIEIKNCQFNPELTGGITVLDNFIEAKVNPNSRSSVAISNCRMNTSSGTPQVRWFKLPNVITMSALVDDSVNAGMQYVDAADAEGIAESSGIDFDNLKNFAQDGSVAIDSWDYLVSRQDTMGIHAGLAYQLLEATYLDQVGVPSYGKVKIDDILCVSQHNQGTKTVSGAGTSGVDTTDYRGVKVRTRTATVDGGSYSMQWNSFIDQSMIGVDALGDNLSMTLLVELEYAQAKQGSAEVLVNIAGNSRRYPLRTGNNTYAVPFVYFNTTGAADSSVDRLKITAQSLSNGDAVSFKRMAVLKGFKRTDIEQITAYQEGVSTPSDILNTNFDSTAGWVKGDRVLSHAASAEVPFYVCSTEQTATTVWASAPAMT